MVEGNPAEESKTHFPESVNVPLMAKFNLSSVFLDPSIGEIYTGKNQAKEEVFE